MFKVDGYRAYLSFVYYYEPGVWYLNLSCTLRSI